MDSTIAHALGFAVLGAIAGWVWTTVTMVSCGSVRLALKNTAARDRWTVWLSFFFNPCPYLVALAAYGVYAVLIGTLSAWFAIGFILPLLPVAKELWLKSPQKRGDDA